MERAKKTEVDVAWQSGYFKGIKAYLSNKGERPSDILLGDIARKSLQESLDTGNGTIRDQMNM